MAEQRDHLDYVQTGFGDTGQDNTVSIQPVNNAEGVTQDVLRRPTENLRSRTELVREQLDELLYYRDFNHLAIEGAVGHTIEWSGVGAGGLITQTGALTVRPFLTPNTSTKATLSVGVLGVSQLTYDVAVGAYASQRLNAVTIEHRDTGIAALAVAITEGPVKRILVSFDSTNIAHDSATAQAALTAAIALDADLAGNLTVTDNGVAGSAIIDIVETRLEGTADQEAHVIPDGLLTAFTAANPLTEGDTIAIWYRYLVEPPAGFGADPKGGLAGGRWESNPDRGTSGIPLGSLFVTTAHPERIPGAVPLCKVVGDELVWIDGSRYIAGMVGPLGAAVALYIDDTNFQGVATNTIAGGITTPVDNAQDALDYVDDRLGNLRAYTYVCTDGTNAVDHSVGGDFNSPNAIDAAIAAIQAGAGTDGGVIFVRRGVYTVANPFIVPDNVRIVGEARELVEMTSLGDIIIGNHAGIEHASIISGGLISVEPYGRLAWAMARAWVGVEVYLSGLLERVWVLDGYVTLLGDHARALDVEVHAGAFTSSGDYQTISSLLLNSSDTHVFSGSYTAVNSVKITTGALWVSGDYLTLSNFDVQTTGVGPVATVTWLASYSSFKDSYIAPHLGGGLLLWVHTSVASCFTGIHAVNTLNSVVYVWDSPKTVFQNCDFSSTGGGVVAADGDDVTFDTCRLVNDHAGPTSHTVGAWITDVFLTFRNCKLSTSGRYEHQLVLHGQDATACPKWEFTGCELRGGSYRTYNVNITNASFRNCKFVLDNDGGQLLAGTASGWVSPVWEFWKGTLGEGCVLEDCVFDCGDTGVELDGAVPTFAGTVLLLNLINSKARNIKLTEVSWTPHLFWGGGFAPPLATTNPGALIRLNYSELDGCELEYSGVGVVGIITSVFCLESYSLLRNVALNNHPNSGLSYSYLFIKGTHIRIEKVQFDGPVHPWLLFVGGGWTINWFSVGNAVFGRNTAMGYPPTLTCGTEWKITNSQFKCDRIGWPALYIDTNAVDLFGCCIANCEFRNIADIASAAMPTVDVVAAGSVNFLRLSHNLFMMTDSAGGARSFCTFAVAYSTAFGNVVMNIGGTSVPGAARWNGAGAGAGAGPLNNIGIGV